MTSMTHEQNQTKNKNENQNQNKKSNRGFASMDEARQREIARQGGKAAHERGTAHEWSSEEAREAGQKGGTKSHSNRNPQPLRGNANEQLTSTERRTG